MADKFLQEFNATFSTGSHVWRASEDFLVQLRKVADDTPQTIFDSCERTSVARSSLYKSVSPYCNLIIGPQTIVDKSIEGVIETIRVPITIEAIFKINERDSDGALTDVQGWIAWLQERIEQYLQPKDDGFPNGMVKTVPWVWNWSSGALDKSQIGRTVRRIADAGSPVTGSVYALDLTYDIDVWPTHPLT